MFGEMHSIKTESCTYVCALGITYEGTFHRGKKHGKGKKTWPTGEEYIGDFALGLEHGMGTKIYNDLSTFEGRFRFGIRDGPGIFTGADGSKLKGQFKDTRLESEEERRVKSDNMLLKQFSTETLLELCTNALAVAVATKPDLYSSDVLKRALPTKRKLVIAETFVRNMEGLSAVFKEMVPRIAWNNDPIMNLSGTRLNKKDLFLLLYFLDTNSTLVELCMASCGLDAATISLFGRVMTQSKNLRLVDFSWNRIGKQGAQALGFLLMHGCEGINTLKLSGCNVGPTGGEFLAKMLHKNRSLRCLELPYNEIGPLGASYFGDMLSVNDNLQELNLQANRIGPTGGSALARGLLKNSGALTLLKVADNNLGDIAAMRIASCMRGTAGEGLESFSCSSLNGPFCISGVLQAKSEQRKSIAKKRTKMKMQKKPQTEEHKKQSNNNKADIEDIADKMPRNISGKLYGPPLRPLGGVSGGPSKGRTLAGRQTDHLAH